eukprot:88046-Rhodomonas_salina.1
MALLLLVQPSVRAMRVTVLANACRFLWRDYDSSFLFWEVCPELSCTPKHCVPWTTVTIP